MFRHMLDRPLAKVTTIGFGKVVKRHSDRTECALHGLPIVTIYPDQLVFDCHGYKQKAVKKAMNEFLAVLDIPAIVQFNEERIVVRYKDLTYREENETGTVTFPA